jgi:hypothetical protein
MATRGYTKSGTCLRADRRATGAVVVVGITVESAILSTSVSSSSSLAEPAIPWVDGRSTEGIGIIL